MSELYPWWVYLHVAGAFIFAAAHGTSAIASFRIRSATDQGTVRTLLDLSNVAVGLMYVGLLLLLIGGVVAGMVGGHFGRGWIWLSLGLLIATIVAMYAMATPYYRRIREAVGAETREPRPADAPVASPAEIQALVRNGRPMALLLVGLVGFLVILWLMFFKPF